MTPLRFIPTRAGKIAPVGINQAAVGVHPHSRGENAIYRHSPHVGHGSSPLARGKSFHASDAFCGRRFIPTRAGKIGADQ